MSGIIRLMFVSLPPRYWCYRRRACHEHPRVEKTCKKKTMVGARCCRRSTHPVLFELLARVFCVLFFGNTRTSVSSTLCFLLQLKAGEVLRARSVRFFFFLPHTHVSHNVSNGTLCFQFQFKAGWTMHHTAAVAGCVEGTTTYRTDSRFRSERATS